VENEKKACFGGDRIQFIEAHLQEAAPPRSSSGPVMTPDCPVSNDPDRPVSGIFRPCLFRKLHLTPERETGQFAKRKTGLFRAVWIEDLQPPLSAGD